MEGFEDLLHDARKLTAEIDFGNNLPHVERSLNQILESAHRLASKASIQVPENAEIKASLLLGSRGCDVQQMSQKLEAITSLPSYETLETVSDTDVQNFLRNERENMLLSIMEQTKKKTFDEVDRRHWACTVGEWEREKQKILNALVNAGHTEVNFIQEPDNILGPSTSGFGLSSEERAFAAELYKYNEAVLSGSSKTNLVSMFSRVAQIQENQNINELWKIVSEMSKISIPIGNLKIEKMRVKSEMIIQIIRGATKYLEESFLQYMSNTVISHLETAKLGGKPGKYSIIESYLRLIANNLPPGFENIFVEPSCPIWPFVYLSLRCGDLKSAWNAIKKVQQSLDNFPQFFHEYMQSSDRRMSMASERDLRLQYRSVIKNSTDLYKKAVYCILGRCDLHNDHSEIADKTDDYLWLKLQQVNVGDFEVGVQQEQLSLAQLQNLLFVDFGENHFRANDQPYLYFRVLFLTGQFEAALEFLARFDQLRSHAVHVAIALHELGLLLTSHNTNAPSLSKEQSDPEGMYRLNMARILITYCRRFEIVSPMDALNYYFCLRDLKTNDDENSFMLCVKDLVLKTQDFELLFQPLTNEISKKHTVQVNELLEKLLTKALHEQPTVQSVVTIAEKYWEQCSHYQSDHVSSDSLNPEKVVEVINNLLSQVVVLSPQALSRRERVGQLAVAVAERYHAWNLPRSNSSVNTLHLLLDFMTVFDSYHGNNFEEVSNIMKDLGIVPFTMDAVESKVKAFFDLSNEVRKCLPDILLVTVGALLTLYKKSRATASNVNSEKGSVPIKRANDGGLQIYLDTLRMQVRAIIAYAGMIPYHLPEDTNARLLQMEIQMN